jgi:hypothetical protein
VELTCVSCAVDSSLCSDVGCRVPLWTDEESGVAGRPPSSKTAETLDSTLPLAHNIQMQSAQGRTQSGAPRRAAEESNRRRQTVQVNSDDVTTKLGRLRPVSRRHFIGQFDPGSEVGPRQKPAADGQRYDVGAVSDVKLQRIIQPCWPMNYVCVHRDRS